MDSYVEAGEIFYFRDLKLGTYISEDGLAWVTLRLFNHFLFNRPIVASYRPYGSFTIDKEQLVLRDGDCEYIFEIGDDCLIYLGTKVEGIFPPYEKANYLFYLSGY